MDPAIADILSLAVATIERVIALPAYRESALARAPGRHARPRLRAHGPLAGSGLSPCDSRREPEHGRNH
jgi:hypothetical protein